MKTSATILLHPAHYEAYAAQLPDTVSLLDKAEAIRRVMLLERWDIAKRGGWELGFVESQVSARFIITIQARFGVIVSRRSLFLWERRYRAGGLAALVDGRSNRKKSARRGRIEGGS
jgi:hypothetical protein